MSFALSKILWVLFSPAGLLIALLAGGLVLGAMGRACCQKWGRVLVAAVTLVLIIIALLPVGDWALTPLENRFAFAPPDRVDGIIVIGGDEKTEISEKRGVPTALDSLRRYVEVVDLARRYPDARLVFSGGSGLLNPKAHMLDSQVARALMTDIGVPTERMIFETSSRNTYENAVYTADIVRPQPEQNWLLVTSAWHMPRAIGCFRRAGWHVYAAPGGYFTTGDYTLSLRLNFDEQMRNLTLAAHEYVGLVSYRLMGRISALWPR